MITLPAGSITPILSCCASSSRRSGWKKFGEEPKVVAIHAGLECGLFAKKIPGLDLISLGPNMYDVHTPDERLSISSTIRIWEYLKLVLARLK